MIVLKDEELCCGKVMHLDTCNQSMMHTPEADITSYTCLECGHYITVVDDVKDEEHLNDLKESIREEKE